MIIFINSTSSFNESKSCIIFWFPNPWWKKQKQTQSLKLVKLSISQLSKISFTPTAKSFVGSPSYWWGNSNATKRRISTNPHKYQEVLKILSSWISYQASNPQVLSSLMGSQKWRKILPPYSRENNKQILA